MIITMMVIIVTYMYNTETDYKYDLILINVTFSLVREVTGVNVNMRVNHFFDI